LGCCDLRIPDARGLSCLLTRGQSSKLNRRAGRKHVPPSSFYGKDGLPEPIIPILICWLDRTERESWTIARLDPREEKPEIKDIPLFRSHVAPLPSMANSFGRTIEQRIPSFQSLFRIERLVLISLVIARHRKKRFTPAFAAGEQPDWPQFQHLHAIAGCDYLCGMASQTQSAEQLAMQSF